MNKTISILKDLPQDLSPFKEAFLIQKKVSEVGFDWKTPSEILPKLKEEIDELKNALKRNQRMECKKEIGDLLFSIINLARHLDLEIDQMFLEVHQFKKQKINEKKIYFEICSKIEKIQSLLNPPDKSSLKDLLSEIISNIYSFAESIHTDPEESLRQTNLRFKKRFLYIEETIKRQKRNIKDVSLQELDRLWEEAKDFDHKNC